MNSPAPYVALVLYGPAEIDAWRLADLLEAIRVHDGDACAAVLVLNDGNAVLPKDVGGTAVHVVPNPRRGRGWAWGGGSIAAEVWAWAWLAERYPQASAMVKFDTDALVVRPLAQQLTEAFADPTVGMVGSRIGTEPLPPYKTTNSHAYFANKVRKLRAPLSLWRKPRWHVRQALRGRHRWVSSLYAAAEQHGYVEGELVEGGAFAVSMAVARRLGEMGITERWEDFLDLPVSDDVLLTALPYVAGFRAEDAPLFCIEPATLRDTPEAMLGDERVGVVHSTKRVGAMTEEEIRSDFRRLRTP